MAWGACSVCPASERNLLAAVHGRRKQATFRRQCLLELGQEAWKFLGILVHRCPDGRWEVPCSELFDLLQVHGEERMRSAFAACCARERYEVANVVAALREVAA